MKSFFRESSRLPALIRVLLPVLAIPALGAFVGLSTRQGVETWYQTLQKPPFTPPDWAFGATWTLLYVMMGLSLGLLWQRAGDIPRFIFRLFALQLGVNLVWSHLFFQMHWLWFSVVWIGGLIGLTAWLIGALWHHHRLSSLLLWPYLGWLCFALTLGFGIARLNS